MGSLLWPSLSLPPPLFHPSSRAVSVFLSPLFRSRLLLPPTCIYSPFRVLYGSVAARGKTGPSRDEIRARIDRISGSACRRAFWRLKFKAVGFRTGGILFPAIHRRIRRVNALACSRVVTMSAWYAGGMVRGTTN